MNDLKDKIQYEGFLKCDDLSRGPYMKFQPFSGTDFTAFRSYEFNRFFSLKLITEEEINERYIPFSNKRGSEINLYRRSLAHTIYFLEIKDKAFGRWSLFQGLIIPGEEKSGI